MLSILWISLILPFSIAIFSLIVAVHENNKLIDKLINYYEDKNIKDKNLE